MQQLPVEALGLYPTLAQGEEQCGIAASLRGHIAPIPEDRAGAHLGGKRQRRPLSSGPRRRMSRPPKASRDFDKACKEWCSHQRRAAPSGLTPALSWSNTATQTTGLPVATAVARARLSRMRRSLRKRTITGLLEPDWVTSCIHDPDKRCVLFGVIRACNTTEGMRRPKLLGNKSQRNIRLDFASKLRRIAGERASCATSYSSPA